MPIGLKYQGYGASDNDVWTINSYYRISDERGQEKKKTVRLYKFSFLYIHMCRGILDPPKKFLGRYNVQFQEID